MQTAFYIWVATGVLTLIWTGPWIYRSFTRGGFHDGMLIVLFSVIMAVIFLPLTALGLIIVAWEKVTGKKIT